MPNFDIKLINSALEAGNARATAVSNPKYPVTHADGFTGAPRNFDLSSFRKGDRFLVTGKEEIFSQVVSHRRDGSPVYAEFAVVAVTNEVDDHKSVVAKNFYISSVNKIRTEYIEQTDGSWKKLDESRKNRGTLVTESMQYGSNSDFWKALKGRFVSIDEVEEFYTLKFGAEDLTDSKNYRKEKVYTWNVTKKEEAIDVDNLDSDDSTDDTTDATE